MGPRLPLSPPVCMEVAVLHARHRPQMVPSGLAGSVAVGDVRGMYGVVGTSAGMGPSSVPSTVTVLVRLSW